MAGLWATATNGDSISATVAGGVIGGDRFRLETGRSGRWHVFSRLDGPVEAADLAGAVVLLRYDGRRVWAGPGEWLRLDRVTRGAEVLVHWLAETQAERARLLADLDLGPDFEATVTGPAEVRAGQTEPALAA